MIMSGGEVRVLVATKPVDFRLGAPGLALLVHESFHENPYSGTIYVFRSKKSNRVKLLYSDGTGICLLSKTLDSGRFCWPTIADGTMPLTQTQLAMLLKGLEWKHVRLV